MTISRLRHYRYVVDIAAMVPDHLEQVWNELHGSLRTALETIVRDNTDHYGIEADVRVDSTGATPAWVEGEDCAECGQPVNAEMINADHEPWCSLHPDNVTCAHGAKDVNDRNQFYCVLCGEELGR